MSSFEEAFELTGHGIFNYLALLTNGFVLLYVTVECLGLGYVLNRAICDLEVDIPQRGTISAATLIGVVTPAIAWGYLADTHGRRRVMLPAMVLSVVCSMLSSLSFNFWSMFLLRVLTGIMVSASCATVYVYLGELTSPSKRTAYIAYGAVFIAGAYLAMPAVAWILLPMNFSVHVTGKLSIVSWRVLMWANTIWGTIACVGIFFLPESPSFLLAAKGGPASLEVLAKIYSRNMRKKAEEFPIKELTAPPVYRMTFKEHLAHMKHFFRPPLLKCVIISHVLNFVVYMQSNAVYIWMPHIVDELLKYTATHPHRSLCRTMNDVHEKVHVTLGECKNDVDSLVYPIAMILFIPSAAVFIGIRFGIKILGKTAMYSIIMCSSSIFILLSAFVPSTIAAIVLYVPGMCGNAANTVLAAAVVEVFPTNLRALAMCTLYMMGRLGSTVGMNILAWGITHSCLAGILVINILAMASGALLWLWPDPAKTRATMEAQNFTY